MLTEREIVKARRQAWFITPTVMATIYGLSRLVRLEFPHFGHVSQHNTLPFGGALSGWPAIFRGFWPFDLLMVCGLPTAAVVLIVYAYQSSERKLDEPELNTWRSGLVIAYMFGSIIGTIAAVATDWFGGLQLLFIGIVLVAALLSFIEVLNRVMRLVATCFGRYLQPLISRFRSHWRREIPKPLQPIRNFLQATDKSDVPHDSHPSI